MAGDVRYCSNCRRDIAAANYVIHSVHCERNIELCGACNEPVPRKEMQKHMEDYHTLDECELCGDEMEKFQMEDHRDICRKRLVPCKFCNLECPFDEAEEHQNECGARTEKCATCKAYVKLADQDAHKAVCQRERRVKQLSTCEFCALVMPTSLLQQHAASCGSTTENCPQCFEPVALKDKYRHQCQVACIPCEYCDTSIRSDLFFDHVSICGLQFRNCPKCNASFMLKDRATHTCQSPSKVGGQCNICHMTVPWVDLREHQAGCRLVAYSSGEEEEAEKPKFSAIPTHQRKQPSYRQDDSRPQKKHQEAPTILSPSKIGGQCSICHMTVPWVDMKEHKAGCRLVAYSSGEEEAEKPKYSAIPTHQRNQPSYRQDDSRPQKKHQEAPTIQKMKQCPHCKERYPDLIVEEHSKDCRHRSVECEFCGKSIVLKDKQRHEKRECLMRHSTNYNYEDNGNYLPEGASGYTKEYEKRLKVCPYCYKKFPELMLIDHQTVCDECPHQCSLCLKMMPIKSKGYHESNECIHIDRFNKKVSGPETPKSKDVPVYKRSFDKDYLEKSFQNCPYCNNKIPEAKIANHIQYCTKGKKPCHFCGAEIGIDEEKRHMQEDCTANKDEDSGFQKAGGKRGKRKNKKGKQTESDQTNLISKAKDFIFGKKSDGPGKEYVPETYFGNDTVQLPCEFCDELFPIDLLIEHQSGCRPDLVSLPNAADTTNHAGGHRASPNTFHATNSEKRDPRDTGALPKRNRFHRDSAEGTPGEFLSRQSPPKEDIDYYNYPSGVPDRTVEPEAVNKSKPTFSGHDTIPDHKLASYKTEKSVPSKNSATQLFNFSSASGNKSSPHQSKSSLSMFSYQNDSPPRQKHPEPQKTELRAVGAERAEKKGIVRVSRDTPMNSEDEATDKYDENFQVEKNDSRNLDNMTQKYQYAAKLIGSQGEMNIPCADERSDIVQDESYESNDCDAQLARLLSNTEPSDVTEEDAKNDETFGSSFDPREPLSLSNDELSDSFEQFYDAEDDLKSPKKASLENGDLDAYMKYLAKDKDEMIATNHNEQSHGLDKEKVMNCNCGNRICYCSVMGNNNCSDPEDNQGNSNDVETPKLSANRATNFRRKELYESNIDNQISAEIKKRSPEFTEWRRSKNTYSSDSD
ncbi:hypothetical protein JTE90_016306 [Oedothorax gibbosus]|uniref:TRAFD1/XAF1 zinc finger domain-containing protein n=1 Tax=Oedothorax gibbosus TaxID=931172 RepID=A0AAV6U7F4_9ARAC|nr:hypothetical protein JTE90_016306 [Oedothorax gibbosus]